MVQSAYWTAFVPFSARWPLEVHLYPNRQVPDLPSLTDDERADLSRVYLEVLRRMEAVYDDSLPYIAAWHQAPVTSRPRSRVSSPRGVLDQESPGEAEVPRGLGVGHGGLRERRTARRGGQTAALRDTTHGRPHS